MPRLSLYKPERGQDFKYMDRQISEMFQVGGTDVYLHKLLGANTTSSNATVDQPHYTNNSVSNIQDLLLLENRDRTYEPEIYRLRGWYNVQNIDFNLSQFGLFLDNDTIYMTVHINDFIKFIGRKPISGDVIELPHLRDDFALNSFDVSLPRYYQITDVGRASEGFSATWYPHLYRLKCTKITDSQQFASILSQPIAEGSSTTLQDLLSTRAKDLEINAAIIGQAESDAPLSGYETRQFYTMAVDPINGKPIIKTADSTDSDASGIAETAADVAGTPTRSGYTGYLLGDGVPANGATSQFGAGIQFPATAEQNDYFLRNDFMPNRLFRFDGTRWIKVEDSVRMTMTNNDTRSTLKTGFINNTNTNVIGGDTVDERQSLSQALKPQADL